MQRKKHSPKPANGVTRGTDIIDQFASDSEKKMNGVMMKIVKDISRIPVPAKFGKYLGDFEKRITLKSERGILRVMKKDTGRRYFQLPIKDIESPSLLEIISRINAAIEIMNNISSMVKENDKKFEGKIFIITKDGKR